MDQYIFHIERGKALLNVKRTEQALEEFSKALTFDSKGLDALAMVSLCQLNLKRLDEAIGNIHLLISTHPTFSFGFYLLAFYHNLKEKYRDAEEAIREAIRIDPYRADYFGLYANIFHYEKKWNRSLELANEGLAIDPEDTDCLNARATALNKLNRSDEMIQTVDKLLELNPNDPYSHANVGWSKLEQNDHEGARTHFKEALRLQPNLHSAREGLLHSIKAKNPIYRLFLQNLLWLGNLQQYAMYAVLIGVVLFQNYLANQNNIFATIGFYLLIAFVLSSWIMQPLSNLMLRLDPMGKWLLSEKEKFCSSFVGIGLLGTFLCIVLALLMSDQNEKYLTLMMAAVTFILTVVWSRFLEEDEEDRSNKHKIAIAYFTVTGLLAYAYCIYPNWTWADFSFSYFTRGFIAYTWLYRWISK
jgi:tetratricopeptide (TPR) repeat protein